MRLDEVAEVLKQIAFTYPAFRIDADKVPEQIKLWHKHLADVPAEIVLSNLRRHVASEKFAPTIAGLREGFSSEHERLKQSSQDYFSQLEEWRRTAVPPPLIDMATREAWRRGAIRQKEVES